MGLPEQGAKVTEPNPGSDEWLALVREDIVDPARPIVDPHHHLWQRPGSTYMLDELWGDTESGHNVQKTVFVECHSAYRTDGPERMRPLGETLFVAEVAEASASGAGATIAGIVGHADLTLGEAVEEVLLAHTEAGRGLFRGIRHAGARAVVPEELMIPGRAPEGLYQSEGFQEGMRTLGRLGLTYDTWQYHYQLSELTELARSCPDTIMVIDHFSTPIGVGRFAGRRKEVFDQWKVDFAELAQCPNVVAKLGGIAMPDNGFGWHTRRTPATSDELQLAHAPYYLHAIESFGTDRCMLESNFPVDRFSISYHVLWNGLKKITAAFSETEKNDLFSGTATRVYQL